MIRARYTEKPVVIDILSKSFDDNKSINYIVKQDKKRKMRIRRLIDYSAEICFMFGKVYLSDDRHGCALILLPEKKKSTLITILLDIKLAFSVIGIFRSLKIMSRESIIKSFHPKEPFYHLWFIGVDPSYQSKGTGSIILKEVIEDCNLEKRPICLETSTMRNLPWYEKSGFSIYKELNDFGYNFYMMKKELS